MDKKRMTQEDMVLNHLKVYGEIDPLTAMREYAIMRLSAIIYNLRNQGYNIETNDTASKNRFGVTVNFATYVLKESK